MLGICCIIWSLSTVTSGLVNSFGVLFIMRFILGAFQSAQTPTSLTLLSDYFPKNKRSTVNSILNSGVYIGSALSSFSIITIGQYGWRSTFALMGGIGVAIGTAILLFMKEPERGRFDTESKIEK
jgi:MFS family permease